MHSRKSYQVIGIVLACVLTILLILAIMTGVSYAKDKGKIGKGVTIYGEDFSRLSQEEYQEKMKSLERQVKKKTVKFRYDNEKSDISLADLKYNFKRDETYEKAYEVGRNGNFFQNAGHHFLTIFGKKTAVQPVATLDKEACNNALQKVVEATKGKVVEHSINIEEENVVIKPGHSGLAVKGDYQKETLDAIGKGSYIVRVNLTTQHPKDIDVESLVKEVYRDPQDATCVTGEKNFEIVPAVVGRKLDATAAKNALDNLKEDGETITIALELTQPKITTAQLKANLFKNTLATATSVYNSSQVDRSANVIKAVQYINGVIIAPGKTFSYNEAVGPRTQARGFRNAQIYVNNAVEMGMGGGICQVSSTLYNAVLKADLTVVQRKAHSLPVTYVPLGQDATVSYGSVDFRFKNSTNYPIKVSASASGGRINVALIGTQEGAKKEVVLTNVTKETLNYKTEEVKDNTLPEGTRKVIQRGKKGYVINTYKKVYQNGAVISNKMIHTSRYNATTEKVAIGTGKKETAPAATPASPPASTTNPPAVEAETATETETETETGTLLEAPATEEAQQH